MLEFLLNEYKDNLYISNLQINGVKGVKFGVKVAPFPNPSPERWREREYSKLQKTLTVQEAKNGKYFQPFVRVENFQPLLEPIEPFEPIKSVQLIEPPKPLKPHKPLKPLKLLELL